MMIVLAFRVVGARRKHRVLFGDGGIEPVVLATRAFGNAAECHHLKALVRGP